jgi:drug/metabolite transporter (DMT)-like permease
MSRFKGAWYLYAIVSAFLFGASTPAAKYLLGEIEPWLLAGIFYLGSGLGIICILVIQSLIKRQSMPEPDLNKRDWTFLLIATVFGGIIGPVLLMQGLVNSAAADVSLLLILESVFTFIIAWLIFKEHTNKQLILGVLLIIIGSIVLGFNTDNDVNLESVTLIIGACLAWAIDNNITRNISASNPLKIVAFKSTVAGVTNISLAVLLGAAIPKDISVIFTSAVVGFLGYGFSLVLFVLSLRHIGTARTSAYFSISPFIGAACAVIFLGEPLTWQLITAGIFMGLGIWLHVTEQHDHWHEHEYLIHDHQHVHDEHHQHTHKESDPSSEPHSHMHEHMPLAHAHFHYPDIHHRHEHKK